MNDNDDDLVTVKPEQRAAPYLEIGEGDGPATGWVIAWQQQGTVALQAADVEAVVGGGCWSVYLAGIERSLFGCVVEQRDTFHWEPPLTWRLIESVGHLDSEQMRQKEMDSIFFMLNFMY